MAYTPILLEKTVEIRELFSVHYFEYSRDYRFRGERHDFWELVYVDSGTVQVTADEEVHSLSRGQMIFHAPGEFHSLSANGEVAPNLVVIGFQCTGAAMEFFRGRITFAGAAERALLARVVEESRGAFSTPLDDPGTKAVLRKERERPAGCEQLIAGALEELLIRLLRQGDSLPRTAAIGAPLHSGGLPEEILSYMEKRLDQPLTVDQICRDNMIGRSRLQSLFHEETGSGVMDYFSRMKINAARRMIREGNLNFTQIAEMLGFQSVHYFSRRFKDLTGMSPREYRDSVKMLTEVGQLLSDDRTNNM